jgi:hypothetical protein
MRLAGVVALHINAGVQRELHDALGRHGIPVAMLDNSFPQDFGIRVAGDDIGAWSPRSLTLPTIWGTGASR